MLSVSRNYEAERHASNLQWLVIRIRQLLDGEHKEQIEGIIRAALPAYEEEYLCP